MKDDDREKLRELAGAWRLVTSEFRTSSGQVIFPLGEDARGTFILAASGHMSAQLTASDRAPFVAGDPRGGTGVEIAAAFGSYIAYYGTVELDAGRGTFVTHVEGSLFPNWVGGDQLRYYEFNADRLILRTPPFDSGGVTFVGVLEWQRC